MLIPSDREKLSPRCSLAHADFIGAASSSLEKTVNHATVVYDSLLRNVDPIPWLARPGYVKKPQDSSTYAHVNLEVP
jgi:hypothetical protein